ncbi:MAG: hypothetical protein QM768_00975 [Agriterribacter sp.]
MQQKKNMQLRRNKKKRLDGNPAPFLNPISYEKPNNRPLFKAKRCKEFKIFAHVCIILKNMYNILRDIQKRNTNRYNKKGLDRHPARF